MGIKTNIIKGLASLCIISASASAQPIAFPGAEGFGKFASGGRGGKVIYVTNLNDDGPGSFREAVTAKYPRIVMFKVSGTIHLESPLSINQDHITIAGQTAPGDGICLADHPVGLRANNAIIRYLRFRMGDRNQNKGKVHGAGGDDAFGGGNGKKNIIIDHCTMSWSTDEAFSLYAGDSTTIQYNIISEPLNYSYHFEQGDTDFERHGFGGIWGGAHLSAHHNLFAHCNSRTPRFEGNRHIPQEFIDFRNNVIYNWGINNVYAGEGGNYNIVNNYYKYGPSTQEKVKYQVANPYKLEGKIPFGKYYITGNYVDGAQEVSKDNWLGVLMNKGTEADKNQSKMKTAFTAVEIKGETPAAAFRKILSQGGASLPARDTLDQRIIKNVQNRTGGLIDVQGGFKHGTPYEKTTKAWPVLKSLPAPKDTDGDGMPDSWEIKNKLNPKDQTDGTGYSLNKAYTNVEVYLNSLDKNNK
ncbi:pectate lyase family protein [Desertivirga brevis]|uniref:pectate lyase family protein n=1 Tax=Desertivirga brevis TaxID=2810310 RepID=UPI001A97366E|nr:pectate lyase [Pedobacter sp. SYSU D00873]